MSEIYNKNETRDKNETHDKSETYDTNGTCDKNEIHSRNEAYSRNETYSYIGKYRIIRQLGRGGEGAVYLAADEDLGRQVAVKRAASGLKQEAEFLQRLSHPMLPVVYELTWDGAWYLVMEYIRGDTLRGYIERNGYAGPRQALDWAAQLADVLCYLHERKTPVIYRDLKPDNLIVCPDGRLRLVDFGGAAQHSFDGHGAHRMAATPGYAAPEQTGEGGADGGCSIYADERSDIYALGRVLYYIVTASDPAKPPYTMFSVRSFQPLLPAAFEKMIVKCMNREPEKRYQVAADVKKAVLRCRRQRLVLRKKSFVRMVEQKVWLTEGQEEEIRPEKFVQYS